MDMPGPEEEPRLDTLIPQEGQPVMAAPIVATFIAANGSGAMNPPQDEGEATAPLHPAPAPHYGAALAAVAQRINGEIEAKASASPIKRASNRGQLREAIAGPLSRTQTLVLRLSDTGNAGDDAYLLKSAMQLLLEYPGRDRVRLDIAAGGHRTRVEMPLVTTGYCPELEQRLAALIGQGCARVQE
jgi:hypothetical protein